MLLGKLAKDLQDVLFDILGPGIGTKSDHGGGEIGAVNRVMDGDGDLKLIGTGRMASDPSPHWLENEYYYLRSMRSMKLTVRLAKADVILGRFSVTTLESLRLTAAEALDSN